MQIKTHYDENNKIHTYEVSIAASEEEALALFHAALMQIRDFPKKASGHG